MADSAVINSIYEELLHRPADPQGLAFYSASDGSTIASSLFSSAEFVAAATMDMFWAYLGRAPQQSEQTAFSLLWQQGATLQNVRTDILASPEYFARAGGTNTGFVDQLYQDLLHRSADANAGVFINALNAGTLTRSQVAADLLNSTEFSTDLVKHYYQTMLGRTATGTELGGAVNFVQLNGEKAFVANLLGSAEFASKADGGTAAYTNTGIPSGPFSVGNGFSLVLTSGADVHEATGTAAAVTVSAGGTVDVQSGATISGGIDFSGVGGVLKIDGSSLPSDPSKLLDGAVIYRFAAGDTIDLTGIGGTGHVDLAAGNVLKITEGSQVYDLQLDPAQDFSGKFFHLAPDTGSGTLVTEDTVPCYCRGTLIATPAGEVPVETLEIGDEVITASGALRPIKWIGRRSYSGRFILGRKDVLPICFKVGSIADNVPARDLWISPHHAMFLEGVLIEARDLINGVTVVQAEHVEGVEYFHVELDSHDVLIAEGALSESFLDDDSRGMFHNVHEYYAAYAEERTAVVRYCAPRLSDGFVVGRVRRRLDIRAGIGAAVEARTAPLRGFIDLVGPRSVVGWAQNPENPEVPVCLDILAGGRLIGQVLANQYRSDLAYAGMGSGRHAFSFEFSGGVALDPAEITVRRSLDGSRLASLTPPRRRMLKKVPN